MKSFILLIFTGITLFSHSQSVEGTEIGFDGFFGASTNGGAFGIGPKFGFRMNENLILGPTVRLQRSWSNSYGQKYSYNYYGAGAFVHARYKNILYGGAEFELIKTPITYYSSNKWAPTLFLCGGFSKEWNETFRLNVGVYYDIINPENSPFRSAYFMKVTNPTTGQVTKIIPLIYRLSIFFRLGH